MPLSFDQFVGQLAASGLLSSDDVSAWVASLPADRRPQDGKQLARELVRHKKLTACQAHRIYAGQGQSLVLGNYLILDKLGQGGMGLVLKARHRRMERLVALKVLSPKVVRSPAALQRFQREAKAAARLMHPNIVVAYDADEAAGTHFLVLEYVDGTDLSSLVRHGGPLPLEQALDYILQAARGLQYAHNHGVVHRDVKPANLLLDRQGVVKILDLGLARLDSADGPQDELTGTGQVMGTVDYMAPEQAVNSKNADARADIYGLGITFWYLLTGGPVYAGDTAAERLMAHQTKTIPSLRSACPEVSSGLDAVFAKMVAKTPEARYQTMVEAIADLERCRGGEAVSELSMNTSYPSDTRCDDAGSPVAARRTAAVAELNATRLWPAALGDSELGSSRPGLQAETSSSSKSPQPPSQRRKRWTAAGFAGLLLVVLGVWVIVRDKEGHEVARLKVPEGGTVAQETSDEIAASGGNETRERSPPPTTTSISKPAPAPIRPLAAVAPFDATQAKALQVAWAKHLGVEVECTNSLGMKFVLIPPGEFLMGSTPTEIERAVQSCDKEPFQGCIRLEGPQHKVILTQPVYLAVHEVTQTQYEKIMGQNPSHFAATGSGKEFVEGVDTANHPVDTVTGNQALEFCRKLSQQEHLQPFEFEVRDGQMVRSQGTGYRLPTEAEWEFACRAGTMTKWFCGDDETQLDEYAWHLGNSNRVTHPVGQKSPNAWGLYDMHGNVWEWCQDYFREGYYADSPLENPLGPPSEARSRQVYRGGSWHSADWSCLRCGSANRRADAPTYADCGMGFRVAKAVAR